MYINAYGDSFLDRKKRCISSHNQQHREEKIPTGTRTHDVLFVPLPQNVRVKVVAFDHDRHTKTSQIGSTSIPLKDLKLTATKEPTKLTNFLPVKKQAS
jgi:hypothetical protein